MLNGTTLYVMRNAAKLLVTLELSDTYTRGTVTQVATDAAFSFPTTMAWIGDHILVTNSQFDKRNAGQPPTLPFQLLRVAVPSSPVPGGMPRTGGGSDLLPPLILAGLLILLGGVMRRSLWPRLR